MQSIANKKHQEGVTAVARQITESRRRMDRPVGEARVVKCVMQIMGTR